MKHTLLTKKNHCNVLNKLSRYLHTYLVRWNKSFWNTWIQSSVSLPFFHRDITLSWRKHTQKNDESQSHQFIPGKEGLQRLFKCVFSSSFSELYYRRGTFPGWKWENGYSAEAVLMVLEKNINPCWARCWAVFRWVNDIRCMDDLMRVREFFFS